MIAISDFDVMAKNRMYDRDSFIRLAEEISDIFLPVGMTARGEKLRDDIERELHELENSIYQRIQKL